MDIAQNSHGQIFYGIHFYPGVAEYKAPNEEPYRVFLNESTLRAMDPTFAGRPIFVEHVDDVTQDIDELRKEADGWVIESFFNAADGKHWVKFIIVTERAEQAIKKGMKLSNAYVPKSLGAGGLWNGVSYAKEITSGEYEHLAIVRRPRYEESVIMTPEDFKKYNEEKLVELKRLSNSKEKENCKMKLNIFKRTKVENALDPEMCVTLPKSGKEMTIVDLVNAMDEKEMKEKDGNPGLADLSHKVKIHDGSHVSVGELVKRYEDCMNELEALKAKKEDAAEPDKGLALEDKPVDVESTEPKGEKKDAMPDDEGAKEKALELAEHEDKEIEEAKKKNEADKKEAALKKANDLRDAPLKAMFNEEPQIIEFSDDQVARGKARYGSKK